MEAFEKAVELGAHGIELDVQLSRDGKVVVIHDERLNRTSNGSGFVKDYYYEELLAFNYSHGNTTYPHCKIPRLKDVLAWASAKDVYLNIELKTGRFPYPGIEDKVARQITQYAMTDQVTVSSFNHYSLKRFKALAPKVRLGILVTDAIVSPKAYMDAIGAKAYHVPAHIFRRQLEEGEGFEGVDVSLWHSEELKEWAKNQDVYSVILDDIS